jgi:hypothetical protein
VHLRPFQCPKSQCPFRAGGSHQINRHQKAAHPGESIEPYREQDVNIDDQLKYRALKKARTYEEIRNICLSTGPTQVNLSAASVGSNVPKDASDKDLTGKEL